LKDQLYSGRIKCPDIPHAFFVPKDILESLVTEAAVTQDIRSRADHIGDDEAQLQSRKVCEHAKQLYAVLAYVKKGPAVQSLLDEGVADRDLPLIEKKLALGHGLARSSMLVRRSGTEIRTFRDWSEKELEKFDRYQWAMTAPVFKDKRHYELDGKAILPFVDFDHPDGRRKPQQGGFAEVYPVRLHPAHQRFWEPNPEVCLCLFYSLSLTHIYTPLPVYP
jgi:hypothetical protein